MILNAISFKDIKSLQPGYGKSLITNNWDSFDTNEIQYELDRPEDWYTTFW